MPYKISFSIITVKIPFLSNLLISLYYKPVKGVFYTRTNIFTSGDYFVDISMEIK